MSVQHSGIRIDQILELGDEFIQDPHSRYEFFRENEPVRRVVFPDGMITWLVTRYADVRAALADPRLSKDAVGMGEMFERHRDPSKPVQEFPLDLAGHMLNSDPPDHTRLRKLVNKAFTARSVERLRPRVAEIAAGLLDRMAGHEQVDLLDAYAFPLPITVICELLGVPDDDRDDFREWTTVLLSTTDRADKLPEAGMAMAGYLAKLIEDKRADPADDLLTALIEASEDGDRLSPAELMSMTFLLLVAGHETTVNLIGTAVLSLLRDREQLAALRADPALLPSAVEEFLRHDGPVNLATMRFTTEPMTIGDVEIPEGEFVMLALSSANRDPERFPEGDRVDVTRSPAAHMAFGHGIHYCVGAPLARMEGEIALGALLERFPDMSLAADPTTLRWRGSAIIRGLETLPVRLGG